MKRFHGHTKAYSIVGYMYRLYVYLMSSCCGFGTLQQNNKS